MRGSLIYGDLNLRNLMGEGDGKRAIGKERRGKRCASREMGGSVFAGDGRVDGDKGRLREGWWLVGKLDGGDLGTLAQAIFRGSPLWLGVEEVCFIGYTQLSSCSQMDATFQ